MNFTILSADYHRNGISGEPFYVGIIADHDNDDRRMLVTWFPELSGNARHVAVLDLDLAATGNVYMHPDPDQPHSGGNAWRGDHFEEAARALPAFVSARFQAAMDRSL